MRRYLPIVGLLGPSGALILVFIMVPIALTLWLSVHQWSTQTGFDTASFVGLRNFEDLFGPTSVGRDFRRAFVNTAVYSGLSIAIILPLSVLFGLLVYQTRVRGGEVLRTILFSTYMVPSIAVALVWSKLYSPTEGPFNQMLGWIGIGPQSWLSSPDTALQSLVYLNVWQQVGYFTVLIVAGLTQIPEVVYDAAKVDGANPWQTFWRITLPLLKRALLFSAVICLINAVQVFEPVVLITQGGPVGSTNVLTFHIRRVGIERAQGGLGSAMAVMLLLTLVVTVVALFALARRTNDE
ncbi:MAG: sugar ABC transporter permease [Bauldia sp.]|uniref:carbohydrate ABC transporter permease n=1 Tax=Bauldia sp. TaxID=2575872 RepID=UPI001DB89498|nr:sugar ABC transporter permease [Bauldia sp.]MCB1497761.1 sugar ABC transporter permease [Bauldia sp.]